MLAAGSEARRAIASLPEGHAALLSSMVGLPGHLAGYAWDGDDLVGVALGLARPTGAVLRLAMLWVAPGIPDRAGTAAAVAQALKTRSREAGILRWRLDAAALVDPVLAPAFNMPQTGDRPLGNAGPLPSGAVPFYPQSTRFTCGPACLLMAFGAFRPDRVPDRSEEIALWREATSIVSLAGPGGCDPFGLALAARAREYGAKVLISTAEPVLLERADTDEKRGLIRFVQAEFRARAQAEGVQSVDGAFDVRHLSAALEEGAIALVLVNQALTQGREAPHWILLHGCADGFFLSHDPWIDPGRGETGADARDVPIPMDTLDRMAWYGDPPYRAAVLLTAGLDRR